DHEIRTQADGPAHGHGGVDAVPARLVAGGRDHPTRLGRAADGHGPAAKLGPVALLHGRVERVHVDVDDASHWGTFSVRRMRRATCSAWSRSSGTAVLSQSSPLRRGPTA